MELTKKLNLQVSCPYIKCPYNCPYCVARFGQDEGLYKNLYKEDKELYFEQLSNVLKTGKIGQIVVSGMTEPNLFRDTWLKDYAQFILNLYRQQHIRIPSTIQTADLTFNCYDEIGEVFSTIAYSIGNRSQLGYIKRNLEHFLVNYRYVRFVMLLSTQFRYEDVVDLIIITSSLKRSHCKVQYTLKYLTDTSNGHKETDNWIKENRLKLTEEQENLLKHFNVWIDKSCMDAASRYAVFREDGNLYPSWFPSEPISIEELGNEELTKTTYKYDVDLEKRIQEGVL